MRRRAKGAGLGPRRKSVVVRATPELSGVIRALRAGRGGPRRLTLAAVRSALQRSGVTWSKEGELLFPQDRTALVIELDEFIDAYGARADARVLASRRKS